MLTRPDTTIINPSTSPMVTMLSSRAEVKDAQSLRTTFSGWGPRL